MHFKLPILFLFFQDNEKKLFYFLNGERGYYFKSIELKAKIVFSFYFDIIIILMLIFLFCEIPHFFIVFSVFQKVKIKF